MTAVLVVLVVIVALLLVLAGSAIRILREYERGVVFRLGRLIEPKGPGLIVLIPIVDRMVRVDLRTITLDVPTQEVITRDNVPVSVNAVVYFRVVDPNRSVTEVENFQHATSQIAQTTLRSRARQGRSRRRCWPSASGSTTTCRRSSTSRPSRGGSRSPPWRSRTSRCPDAMQRAMARQAEAERERRAKIINAEGEAQAAERLAEAADVIGRNPATMQLRYLQSLREIGNAQNATIVFPMPMDVIRPFLETTEQRLRATPRRRPVVARGSVTRTRARRAAVAISASRSTSARKKSRRVTIPAHPAVVDDRHDQHAVVDEDLGEPDVGEVGAARRCARGSCGADRLERQAWRFSIAASIDFGTNAGVPERADVPGEQCGDELALAEDAGVALVGRR